MPISSGLISCDCCLPCCFWPLNSSTKVTSPGCKPGQGVWRSWAAQSTESLSWPHQCCSKESRALRLASALLHGLPAGGRRVWSKHIRGPTPDFSSRFTSEAFPVGGYNCKTVGVCDKSSLLLDELFSQADKPHLPTRSNWFQGATPTSPVSKSSSAGLRD